jgi:hypothetical protein
VAQCGFDVPSRAGRIHVGVGRIECDAQKFEQLGRHYATRVNHDFRSHELLGPNWGQFRKRVPSLIPLAGSPHLGENGKAPGDLPEDQVLGAAEPEPKAGSKRQFFEHAGALFSVVVSPAASTIAVNASRQFKALPRDRSRRPVTDDLQIPRAIS